MADSTREQQKWLQRLELSHALLTKDKRLLFLDEVLLLEQVRELALAQVLTMGQDWVDVRLRSMTQKVQARQTLQTPPEEGE